MNQPPLPPDPAEEPDAPDGGQTGAPRFAMARAVVPDGFEMPSFPAVLPEDPVERAEVLRRFAEWDRQQREAFERSWEAYSARSAGTDDSPYDLTERMRRLGAPDPESWAASESRDNIPQEARWLILRALWSTIDSFAREGTEGVRAAPAAARLLDAGADPGDLSTAMRHAAMSGVFGALVTIDEMTARHVPRNAPGWLLMETRYDPDADDYVTTGRTVGGLHESLSSADPSGREGSDLFE
jgi:hypothetical protein